MIGLPGPRRKLPAGAESAALMYRAANNVNDARKALKIQACPGIGHVKVAPPLL